MTLTSGGSVLSTTPAWAILHPMQMQSCDDHAPTAKLCDATWSLRRGSKPAEATMRSHGGTLLLSNHA